VRRRTFCDAAQMDDAVNVVGHHDERVEMDMGESRRQRVPLGRDHVARSRDAHLSVHDLAKSPATVMDAHGHEIGARSAIVVRRESKAAAIVSLTIVRHDRRSFKIRAVRTPCRSSRPGGHKGRPYGRQTGTQNPARQCRERGTRGGRSGVSATDEDRVTKP
jgi:hypothetical protein